MAQELMKILVPIYLLMVVAEAVYSQFKGKNLYNFKDALSNLQVGAFQLIVEVLQRVAFFFMFKWVFDHLRIATIPNSLFGYLFAIVVVDLATYWAHRSCHRVNILWGTHLVHHQSESYNLSTALRLPALQRLLVFPVFYAPLAILGIGAEPFVLANILIGLNGFWNHTQLIKKVPILEWIIVTPPHHRVHHASNPQYIDKNYSNIFSLWDHVFGSFEEEVEAPVFGITHALKSRTPLEANGEFFKILRANLNGAKTIRAKLKVIFGHPEDLDYSMVLPVSEFEMSFGQKVASVLFFVMGLASMGIFMRANKEIGAHEFSMASMIPAMMSLLFFSLSTRLLRGIEKKESKEGYTISEVKTPLDRMAFLDMVDLIYADDAQFVRPLDQDVEAAFNTKKNPLLKDGIANRWVVRNSDGEVVGRIAAFVTRKATGFGFFESVSDESVGRLLLETAQHFLREQGIATMEGPIQPGERDRFWGARIEGEGIPGYAQNYNPAYYISFYRMIGLDVHYEQKFYGKDLTQAWPANARAAGVRFRQRTGVKFFNHTEITGQAFALACREVYNSAWITHPDHKAMSEAECLSMFEKLEPIMDPELLWLAYEGERPVGFMVLAPEVNTWFKFLNGKFGILQKLQFVIRKKLNPAERVTGIAFGVHPDYQGRGLAFALMDAAIVKHEENPRYKSLELNWIGGFNQKMMSFMEKIGAEVVRKNATFVKSL